MKKNIVRTAIRKVFAKKTNLQKNRWNKKMLSNIQVIIGVVFGIGTFVFPIFVTSKIVLGLFGIIFVSIIFASLFKINQILIRPNNEHYITKEIHDEYYKRDGLISNSTIDWLESLETYEINFVDRLIKFAYLISPFEMNYDTKPKRSGIDGYIFYFNTQPTMMNMFFDNDIEIRRGIQFGLLEDRELSLKNGDQHSFIPGSSLNTYKSKKLLHWKFNENMILSVYRLTERAMEILEGIWENKAYIMDDTCVYIHRQKLQGRCEISEHEYSIKDEEGRRFVVAI